MVERIFCSVVLSDLRFSNKSNSEPEDRAPISSIQMTPRIQLHVFHGENRAMIVTSLCWQTFVSQGELQFHVNHTYVEEEEAENTQTYHIHYISPRRNFREMNDEIKNLNSLLSVLVEQAELSSFLLPCRT